MAVPFSNTHLRVPRGFGTILEGLTREVLRDQPEDIPKYAAQYFEALLKEREENGMDPAEWAAKLEDRFYNNHAFKSTEEGCSQPQKEEDIMDIPLDDPEANRAAAKIQAVFRGHMTRKKLKPEDKAGGEETSPSKETATEVTVSKEKSFESQAEDESSHSEEDSQPNVSEKAENTDKEESVNRFPVAGDEPSDTVMENDPAITVFDQVDWAANETPSSSVPDQNIPQSELEHTDLSSFRGLSNVDVCAQELRAAEDEEGNKRGPAVVHEELVDSGEEENTEVAEPVESIPYSGLADVDVCAAELAGTEGTMKGATAEDVTHVIEENLKHQPEDILVESLVSHSEITENNQEQAEDQPEKAKEERTETEAYSGETHESLAHSKGSLDGNVIPKEDSLVEISSEDFPEAQQISEIMGKQPEEQGSIEALQMDILVMREKEESEELTAVAAGQCFADTEDHKHEMERVEEEVNEAKWTDDLNLSEDDEKEKGENISSLNQHSTEAEKENQDHETNPTIENNEKLSEAIFLKNEDSETETRSDDPDFKEGQDIEETHKEGYSETKDREINDGGVENNLSQVTQSNTSMARMGAESEVFEESAQHQSEENEENQRTLVWSQPEDTVEEKEVTLKEGMTDSEIQEKKDMMLEEENISLPHGADWTADDQQGEEGLLESKKDTTVQESTDKEECSRPQEEEDIMDIPLDDPEANRAAAKIQAGFRGHMTRKKLKPEDKTEGEERQEDRGQ